MSDNRDQTIVACQLQDLDSEDLIELWRERCAETNQMTTYIYDNTPDTINMLFATPMQALTAMGNNVYNPHDRYFSKDYAGDIVTFDTAHEYKSPVNLNLLADFLISNPAYSDFLSRLTMGNPV